MNTNTNSKAGGWRKQAAAIAVACALSPLATAQTAVLGSTTEILSIR
jgi:hypothetical protein